MKPHLIPQPFLASSNIANRGGRFGMALATSVALLVATQNDASAQGCIAIKPPPISSIANPLMLNRDVVPRPSKRAMESHDGKKTMLDESYSDGCADKRWTATVGYRWFTSDKHFSGDVEQKQRQQLDTQVENDVHAIDASISYAFTTRFSGTLTIPYSFSERSSLYEHDLVHRHSTRSHGLGDIRFTADYWLFDPVKYPNGNIALGLGVKFPTGDDDATDKVHRATGDAIRPVDPSIQPGDGGWGIIAELQAYQKIVGDLYAYAAASYLATPQEESDTELTVADVPAFRAFITDEIRHNTIADQYFARAGLSYEVLPAAGLSVSFGGRIEGLPSHDLIGGDLGFRRPGYTVSLEPGVTWLYRDTTVSVTVPIAIYRNRIRSAPEEKLGRPAGDAAFADYFIQASVSHRF